MTETLKTKVEIVPFRFEIERGKIREFAMAIGDKNPIYYDADAAREKGYRDLPAPPTFPTVIDMWGGLDFETIIKKLRLNPLKVLHGEQEYQYLEDMCAGDELIAHPKLLKAYEKMNMKFFVIETVYKNREGRQVLISKSTVIER